MCTLTAVRAIAESGDGGAVLLVAMNRDEKRARPEAEPPRRHAAGERVALYARDPQGGGTWFAVNDAGLVVALLNYYPAEARERAAGEPPPRRSRGRLVAELAGRATTVEALAALEPRHYAPFRLVVLHKDAAEAVEAIWDGADLSRREHALPLFLSSSSFCEAEVVAARRTHYEATAHGALSGAHLEVAAAHEALRRLHFGGEAGRPGSHRILMERPDARTHSVALAQVGADDARLIYWANPTGQPEAPTEGRLAAAPTRR